MTYADLSVVAVDMPMAKSRLVSRRVADNAISSAFGGQGCSTHSPSAIRPGLLGASLTAQLAAEGFLLVTRELDTDGLRSTIEVYPHPALLTLLGRPYRVPDKVTKSGKYWKGTSVETRIARLLDEFREIHAGLESVFGHLGFELPAARDVGTLTALKRFEDALDALVCAWVGLRCADGGATPYGDEDATIWVPQSGDCSKGALSG
jgi:predicted RNase H-like nuclease